MTETLQCSHGSSGTRGKLHDVGLPQSAEVPSHPSKCTVVASFASYMTVRTSVQSCAAPSRQRSVVVVTCSIPPLPFVQFTSLTSETRVSSCVHTVPPSL